MAGDVHGDAGQVFDTAQGGGTVDQDVNLVEVAGASVATGHGTAAGALRVELPTDGTGVVVLGAGSATIGALTPNQTVNQNLIRGGAVSVNAGAVDAGSQRVAVALDTTTLAGSAPGTAGTPSANVVTVQGAASMTPLRASGPTASGAALTESPVTTGGLAKTANPTAVDDGDAVNALHDKLGKQIAVSAVRELKGRQVTTITSSVAETTIVTADATNFLDIFILVITNTSATASTVTIKDATGGSTVWVFSVPAGQTVGFAVDAGSAAKQTTANNNWTATCGTSVASVVITAHFVKNL